jgi:adenosine deaminase
VISYADYLRLLPKTELHCHFVSTMQPTRLLELADKNGVRLASRDVDTLLDSNNLLDFLALFNAAHEVLVTRDDFARLAYDGVRDAVAEGNLRYRETFINPQNFPGRSYVDVVDPILDGLRAAEADFGVGFGVVVAINRSLPAAAATELVQTVIDNPRDGVFGIGQDDLSADGTESPGVWVDAYALAGRHGLKRTAHVGETLEASPRSILVALDDLGCDRIDHGYRAVDDPEVFERLLDDQVPLTCTPHSTRVLSGWQFEPRHRIATMIDGGLNVTFSTDDAVFFRTDIGREYTDVLPAMGFGPDVAKRISRAGAAAAWCPPEQRARLEAEFAAQHLALDALLDPASVVLAPR